MEAFLIHFAPELVILLFGFFWYKGIMEGIDRMYGMDGK